MRSYRNPVRAEPSHSKPPLSKGRGTAKRWRDIQIRCGYPAIHSSPNKLNCRYAAAKLLYFVNQLNFAVNRKAKLNSPDSLQSKFSSDRNLA